MPAPLELSALEDYFTRLRAALKTMPAPVRDEQERELRQHLEQLVAAHSELGVTEEAVHAALRSLGDPARVGRQLCREWERAQAQRISGELWAALCALALYAVTVSVTHVGDIFLGRQMNSAMILTALAGVPLMTGAVTGALFPKLAVPATLYATLCVVSMLWLPAFTLIVVEPRDFASWYALKVFAVQAACWLPLASLAAYGASVLRRGGFYRVPLASLKLMWP